MWRNIIGQGLYQATVLVVLLFAGDEILGLQYVPIKDENGIELDYWMPDGSPTPKCVLYTMIFHTFVFMQVFNEINSRKLGEFEYNVFKGFFNNWLFLLIIVATCAVQCVMVEFGGVPVRCAPLTLN